MCDAIEEVKIRAQRLVKKARAGDPAVIARLRAEVPALRDTALVDAEVAEAVQLKHALALVARELGFRGWPHAREVLGGDTEERDFGTLLYPPRCRGHLTSWHVDHAEARASRAAAAGYLLPFRTQFFVVERGFLEDLGLDPDDADWSAMGYDWAEPQDRDARRRLYGKLLASLPQEA